MAENPSKPSLPGEVPQTEVKITDRRKFDRSGHLRPDAPPDGNQGDGGGTRPAPEARAEQLPTPEPGAASGRPSATGLPPAVDFQSFVYFLYMTALHELGVPTEQGKPAQAPDLDRARFFIDVLQMMKAKTSGNLEAGETKMLDDVLANLQMQFISLSQPPSDS